MAKPKILMSASIHWFGNSVLKRGGRVYVQLTLLLPSASNALTKEAHPCLTSSLSSIWWLEHTTSCTLRRQTQRGWKTPPGRVHRQPNRGGRPLTTFGARRELLDGPERVLRMRLEHSKVRTLSVFFIAKPNTSSVQLYLYINLVYIMIKRHIDNFEPLYSVTTF